MISDFSKMIFLKIYGVEEYPSGLKINVEKEFPKEVTSKGALVHQKQGVQTLDIAAIRKTFTCVEAEGIFELSNLQVNDHVLDKVVEQVEDFNRMFVELNNTLNFEDHFDISQSSFTKFKEIVNQHLKAFLKGGIEYNNRMEGISVQPDSNISETLFFYPIVETIQQLIKEIAILKT